MNNLIIKFSCVVAAVIVCAFRSGAETEFNRARTTLIWGVASEEDTDVEVEVSASSLAPGARCVYETKAEAGQYSQDVKLFPGENIVTTRTASDTYDVYMPLSVSRPSLRVEMSCEDRFYHLVVNDWQGYSYGAGVETYYQREAAAGLYRISVYHMVEGLELVGYDENGNSIWEEVEPVEALTTVKIFVNDELVHMAFNGDGKECWSVGTVVLHSGDQVGGYAADGKRLDLADQGAVCGMSLGAFNGPMCAVTGLWGTNGVNPVFLSVGEASQFGAQGILFQLYYGANQSVNVIDCFTSSDESVGTVDALGVFVAKAPGHTQVSCRHYSGDPIDVYVVKVEMAMDGDRDGEINFDDPDDKKYLFWVNDDCDISQYNEKMWQQDDNNPNKTSHRDWDDDHIGNKGNPGVGACERDLEDFTRLHIKVDPLIANMEGVSYWLRFVGASGGPSVNIFEAVDESAEYLSVPDKAASQVQEVRRVQVSGGWGDCPLDPSIIHTDGSVSCFLLEGCHAGIGALTFVVKINGVEICKQSVTLDLHDIAWFYDAWQAQVLSGERWTVDVTMTANHTQVAGYAPETEEKLLFIHGWNMECWEKRRWTETIFKRLWWQGYKGSVVLFDWPTLADFGGFWDILSDIHHFDNSEFRAWRSSDALSGVIGMLSKSGPITVLAHSMGNVATGEALRKYEGPQIHAYIACQAALSAHHYDFSVAANHPCKHQNYDLAFPSTPDIIGHFASGDANTLPYLSGNITKVARLYNFFNTVDWALDLWEINNVTKPDNWTPYLHSYIGSEDRYQESVDHYFRGPVNNMKEFLSVTNEVQRHRIFAYIEESRSRALGQEENGGFSNWRLDAAYGADGMGYNKEHYSHSREFRSSVIDEWKFWARVLSVIHPAQP